MKKQDWYSPSEAAAILGVSIDTIRRMGKDGRFKRVIKIAGRLVIPANEVHKYLVRVDELEQQPDNTPISINATLQK